MGVLASRRADPSIPQLGPFRPSVGMTFCLGSLDEPAIMSLRESLRAAMVEAGGFLVGAGEGENL